ncbi:hypothetical protein [Fontimonas thermophila]|uniref:hypothetical protein n=1 Tax=Fontimonas thermophila TaxID=1076937 RepID=UPI001F3F96C2|nr:hypothetical protein [Fontimonas thermophila]
MKSKMRVGTSKRQRLIAQPELRRCTALRAPDREVFVGDDRSLVGIAQDLLNSDLGRQILRRRVVVFEDGLDTDFVAVPERQRHVLRLFVAQAQHTDGIQCQFTLDLAVASEQLRLEHEWLIQGIGQRLHRGSAGQLNRRTGGGNAPHRRCGEILLGSVVLQGHSQREGLLRPGRHARQFWSDAQMTDRVGGDTEAVRQADIIRADHGRPRRARDDGAGREVCPGSGFGLDVAVADINHPGIARAPGHPRGDVAVGLALALEMRGRGELERGALIGLIPPPRYRCSGS